MAIRFQELTGGAVEAMDGNIGKVKDILFDDRSWRVRYAVVDTGRWLPGRKVVLAPGSFSAISSEGRLRVKLSKTQIESAPPLEEHLPVSRQYEADLFHHYEWPPYWLSPAAISYPYPDVPFSLVDSSYTIGHADWSNLPQQRAARFEGHLMSLKDMMGYKIGTIDEAEFGKVLDAIVETKDWLVIDLVLKTKVFGGKEIVCSPLFIEDIDEKKGVLRVAQRKETLLESPAFDFASYGESYRKRLVSHYLRKAPQSFYMPQTDHGAHPTL